MPLTYLDLAEVQQWLETTKLTLVDANVVEFEQTAKELVFSSLSQVYDTDLWTDNSDTPALIQKILSLYMAAWVYQRAYSEDSNVVADYSSWLISMAQELIVGLVSGAIDLAEVEGLPGNATGPAFWPDDTTGSSGVYNALGVLVGLEGSEDIKFRMGTVF